VARLFLLFTLVPLVELWLLLRLGRILGPGPTVALVLVTGLVGAFLARREGGRVLRRWREDLAMGRLPEEGLASGLLVLIGGVLLVTPGVLTDLVGLLLLVPGTRRLAALYLRAHVARRLSVHGRVVRTGPVRQGRRPGSPGGEVVEGEVVEEHPPT
jgi:UPF0716 protein FxsA